MASLLWYASIFLDINEIFAHSNQQRPMLSHLQTHRNTREQSIWKAPRLSKLPLRASYHHWEVSQYSDASVPRGFCIILASATPDTKTSPKCLSFRAQKSNSSLFFFKSLLTHLLARAAPRYTCETKPVTTDTRKQHIWYGKTCEETLSDEQETHYPETARETKTVYTLTW